MQRSSFFPPINTDADQPAPLTPLLPLGRGPAPPPPPPPHDVHSNIHFSICSRPHCALWQGDRFDWRVFCTERGPPEHDAVHWEVGAGGWVGGEKKERKKVKRADTDFVYSHETQQRRRLWPTFISAESRHSTAALPPPFSRNETIPTFRRMAEERRWRVSSRFVRLQNVPYRSKRK